MPTIEWKKIGKGSWINIGGSHGSPRLQESRRARFTDLKGQPIRISMQAAIDGGFFNSTGAAKRAIATLRHMHSIPDFSASML